MGGARILGMPIFKKVRGMVSGSVASVKMTVVLLAALLPGMTACDKQTVQAVATSNPVPMAPVMETKLKGPFRLAGGSFDFNGGAGFVKIRKSNLYVGVTEVTQSQYEGVMGNNPSHPSFRGSKLPVNNVTHTEALAFCKKLTDAARSEGWLPADWSFGLPHEWEWSTFYEEEDAAVLKGEVKDAKSGAGAFKDLRKLAVWRRNADDGPREVGSMTVDSNKLYDIRGNMAEWCRNWVDSKRLKVTSQEDTTDSDYTGNLPKPILKYYELIRLNFFHPYEGQKLSLEQLKAHVNPGDKLGSDLKLVANVTLKRDGTVTAVEFTKKSGNALMDTLVIEGGDGVSGAKTVQGIRLSKPQFEFIEREFRKKDPDYVEMLKKHYLAGTSVPFPPDISGDKHTVRLEYLLGGFPVRGGSWADRDPYYLSEAFRLSPRPGTKDPRFGFRLVVVGVPLDL
jgi:formylglycine-generating enzyme required for sulfatase activity